MYEIYAVSSSNARPQVRVMELQAAPAQWRYLLPASNPDPKVRYFCTYCWCQMTDEAEACGHCGAPTRHRYVEVNDGLPKTSS